MMLTLRPRSMRDRLGTPPVGAARRSVASWAQLDAGIAALAGTRFYSPSRAGPARRS